MSGIAYLHVCVGSHMFRKLQRRNGGAVHEAQQSKPSTVAPVFRRFSPCGASRVCTHVLQPHAGAEHCLLRH
jgi:hypothetical protein